MCAFSIPCLPGRPRRAVLLTPSSTLAQPTKWSYLHIGTKPPLKSFACHSYENCRGVGVFFPFWNSTPPHPVVPNFRTFRRANTLRASLSFQGTCKRPICKSFLFKSRQTAGGVPPTESGYQLGAPTHLRDLAEGRRAGQRAKTEVVRPPRGVNSPRTTHHSGWMAATMSRSILLTAFS